MFSGATTTAANYIELTCAAGAFPHGVPKQLSGGATARIITAGTVRHITVNQSHFRLTGVESTYSSATVQAHVFINFINASNDLRFSRNIFGTTVDQPSSNNLGITNADADSVMLVFRNFFFGLGGRALNTSTQHSTSRTNNNTAYACNRANTAVSVFNIGASAENNLVLDPNTAGTCYQPLWAGTFQNCGSSDATGSDASIQNLTAADEIQNATTTWANTDLRIKTGAVSIDAGIDLGSPYDLDITNDSVTGTWDLGADEATVAARYNYLLLLGAGRC